MRFVACGFWAVGSTSATESTTPVHSTGLRRPDTSRHACALANLVVLLRLLQVTRGRPGRLYFCLKTIIPGHGPIQTSVQPEYPADRTNSGHGSPDESAIWSVPCERHLWDKCAIFFRDNAKTPSVKVVEREQTKLGSHGAHPETPGGALRGRFRAPRTVDGPDVNPRVGKGVKTPSPPRSCIQDLNHI